MNRILIPASTPEDWKKFLADPEKQWKKGYSARTLAYCWHAANSIPAEVLSVLKQSTELSGIEPLFIILSITFHYPVVQRRHKMISGFLVKPAHIWYHSPLKGKYPNPSARQLRSGLKIHLPPKKNALNSCVKNELVSTTLPNGIVLYFAWIHGNEKFLEL